MGKRVEGYLKLLESSNGLILFDKSLAIDGIGDDISRSLNPADFTAFSFERENTLFLHGSEQAPNPVVGTVDLTQRYHMELEPSGRCLFRGEDGLERWFGDLDEALHAIIAYLQVRGIDHRSIRLKCAAIRHRPEDVSHMALGPILSPCVR